MDSARDRKANDLQETPTRADRQPGTIHRMGAPLGIAKTTTLMKHATASHSLSAILA